jgi:hypothetical protein
MFHWSREKNGSGSVWSKLLLVAGIVGLGVCAGFLRRRVKIRLPKAEAKVGRGRARAQLQVNITRRRTYGRRGGRRSALGRRVAAAIS